MPALMLAAALWGQAAPLTAATLETQASNALYKAIQFHRTEVAVEGTYLWEYSADLALREGEGVATSTQGWVQPPGTPAVGMAILTAYEATAVPAYLEAARETAAGLSKGQLMSGGWFASIDFDPAQRGKLAYRLDGRPGARNTSTLDDDTTQAALRFLMRLDRILGFRDEAVHGTAMLGLRSLLDAQYPNGAWPQVFRGPPDPKAFAVKPASFPDSWPRTYPGSRNYWSFYTLNDNVLANVIATLFEAEAIYAGSERAEDRALSERSRAAAERGGDFILLAQLPEPQPAWAQQYDFEMQPTWARKFEPPAVTGGESQRILRVLLDLYRRTGKAHYLEPVPRALDYLKRSRLPDGRLARFYELQSNRPLYFTREYVLTHDDGDMPTHYAFKVGDDTGAIERALERLRSRPWSPPPGGEAAGRRSVPSEALVRSIIDAQDAQGRWLEDGPLRHHRPKDPTLRILRSSTFIRNVERLSRFLEEARAAHGKAAVAP